MRKFILIIAAVFAFGCSSQIPYEGKDHPFRVAMRDMKPPYKTIENFEKDANLAAQAQKAALDLKALCESTADMNPAFLTEGQCKAYKKHFSDMVKVIDNFQPAFHSGDVKKAQGLFAELAKVKKAAHGEFYKQAKKHRGGDEK
ncbi:MAG: cytochrome b562 [Lentisphaeraceae bacterium]|nr:cytochrome b562 [Lentisphaeraceae bacterium]